MENTGRKSCVVYQVYFVRAAARGAICEYWKKKLLFSIRYNIFVHALHAARFMCARWNLYNYEHADQKPHATVDLRCRHGINSRPTSFVSGKANECTRWADQGAARAVAWPCPAHFFRIWLWFFHTVLVMHQPTSETLPFSLFRFCPRDTTDRTLK